MLEISIGLVVSSLIISCGMSSLGDIGRQRNEYDDYVQAMVDIQKLRLWDGELGKIHAPHRINALVDGLEKDLRAKFLGDRK